MPRPSVDAVYRKPAVKRRAATKQRVFHYIRLNPVRAVKQAIWIVRHFRTWAPVMLGSTAIILIIGGFAGGALTVLNSKQSLAENQQAPNNNQPIPLSYNQSDLNVVADMLPILIEQNRHQPSPEEIKAQERKDKLKRYLASKGSPFAKNDKALDAFLASDNMKLMIAISFVESGMGLHCYYNNCSGIGGTPPNLRKYPDYAAWIKDFDTLLEKRYKGLPIEKFLGYYVQPGSPNWLAGVKQVLAELKSRGIE